jgi:hypothetical protein
MAMTSMFEAYPVDESARPHGSGLVPLPRAFSTRAPSVTRCARRQAALAADVSEHRGYIFCDDIDSRSKTAERQLAEITLTKNSFLLNVIFEHFLIDSENVLLDLHFCVRLRFLIRH